MFDGSGDFKVLTQQEALELIKELRENGTDALIKVDPNSLTRNTLNAPLGPSKKKLILGSIFEAEGTVQNRVNGTFSFPYGLEEGRDGLRQAMGKYWTYTDSKQDNVFFLNPLIGNEILDLQYFSDYLVIDGRPVTSTSAAPPISIHFDEPELIEGEIWPEYEQTLVITPNPEWIYENFVKKYFDIQSVEIKNQIRKMILDGTLSSSEIQSNIETYLFEEPNEGNEFSGGIIYKIMEAVRDWWFTVMQVPGASAKGCPDLAAAIGRLDDAKEICSPWLQLNTPFLDHVLDVPIPIEKRVSVAAEPLLNAKCPYYSLNSEYNFYIKIYEDLLTLFKNKTTPNPLVENILPNIYPFISSLVPQSLTGEKSDYMKYRALITLNNIVPEKTLFRGNDPDDLGQLPGDLLKKPPTSSKQYFSTWSHYLGRNLTQVENANSNVFNALEAVKNKYNIMHFPMYHTEILRDYNDDKFMFPMYNELNFSTGVQNILGDTMRAARLTNGFMYFYTVFAAGNSLLYKKNENLPEQAFSSDQTESMQQYTKFTEFINVQDTLELIQEDCQPDAKVKNTRDIFLSQLEVTELETFLATFGISNILSLYAPSDGAISNLNLTAQLFEKAYAIANKVVIKDAFKENTTLITVDENDDYIYMKPGYEMQKSILATIFIGKLRKMAKEKLRTYTDIMRGKTNYSEAVMYIVTKSIWGGAPSSEPLGPSGPGKKAMAANDEGDGWQPLQSYYFLNTSKEDVLRFIDTQVNYDVQYRYDIDAVVLSLGSNYSYHDPESIARRVVEFVDNVYHDGVREIEKREWVNLSRISNYTEEAAKDRREGTAGTRPRGPDEIRRSGQTFPAGTPGGRTPERGDGINSDGSTRVIKDKKSKTFQDIQDSEANKRYIPGLDPVTNPSDYTSVRDVSALIEAGGTREVDPNRLDFKLSDIFDPEEAFDNMFRDFPVARDGQVIRGNALTITLKVRQKPSYKLIRVPVATDYGRVLDKPPIFPDVLITPYKGVNDKLLINLNQNVGEYFMKPVTFNANELDQYRKQVEAQKVSLPGQTEACPPEIKYKGDDTISKDGHFEVYRLNRKPQTYGDFEGRLLTKIRGFHDMEVGHMDTDSVSLQDDILPNRKYYYTFRAVDVHGNVSNPTPVFEVEMVDDNGTVYMLQRIIEMAPPDIKDVSKSAKKYIQIKPNFEQSILNIDPRVVAKTDSAFDPDAARGIRLGSMPVSVFGKRYKIRITSKSSGKQIDLNVTFNRTDNKKLAESTVDGIYNPELDK